MADQWKIDKRQIDRFEQDIEKMSKRAIPIAVQQALSNTARNAFNRVRKHTIDDAFDTRNNWTKRSTSFIPAKGLDINDMKSMVGSVQDYMRKQEEGFTRDTTGSGVWVPTANAADQTGRRTKPIRPKFRRNRIRIQRKRGARPTSRAQANYLKLYNAVTSRNGYMWGRMGDTRGMWQIKGQIVDNRVKITDVRLLYSANKKTITTRPHKWLEPASEYALRKQPQEYFNALKRQLRRLKSKGR